MFCFDDAFAKRAAVAITSLCVHATSTRRIYCLVSSVSPTDWALIDELGKRFNADIVFLDVEDGFQDWIVVHGLSSATYYRLLIPMIVPHERAIYLDCDLLVTCDLSDLTSLDVDGAWIAGCVNQSAGQSAPPMTPI